MQGWATHVACGSMSMSMCGSCDKAVRKGKGGPGADARCRWGMCGDFLEKIEKCERL